MTQMFGQRWTASQGDAKAGDRYSKNFLVWCEKTAELTMEEWRWGIATLEKKIADGYQMGSVVWPPTYAEFIGLCHRPVTPPEHKIFPRLGLEDKTAREKRRQLGMEKCGELKKLFE